jgi:hypothetical protein
VSSDQSLFQKRITCRKQKGKEEETKQTHRLRTNRNRLQNLFHGYMLTMKRKDVVKVSFDTANVVMSYQQ